jgi:hypothetical protein
MKRCREAEGIEEVATSKITNKEYMKRCRKDESIDIVASRNKIDSENKKRHRTAESHDAAATQKSNNNTSKIRKGQGWQHNVSTVCHDKEMTNAIKRSTKKAKRILHRTQDPANPHCYRAIVRIKCDLVIIGTEMIDKLTTTRFLNTAKDSLFKHTNHTMGKS